MRRLQQGRVWRQVCYIPTFNIKQRRALNTTLLHT